MCAYFVLPWWKMIKMIVRRYLGPHPNITPPSLVARAPPLLLAGLNPKKSWKCTFKSAHLSTRLGHSRYWWYNYLRWPQWPGHHFILRPDPNYNTRQGQQLACTWDAPKSRINNNCCAQSLNSIFDLIRQPDLWTTWNSSKMQLSSHSLASWHLLTPKVHLPQISFLSPGIKKNPQLSFSFSSQGKLILPHICTVGNEASGMVGQNFFEQAHIE